MYLILCTFVELFISSTQYVTSSETLMFEVLNRRIIALPNYVYNLLNFYCILSAGPFTIQLDILHDASSSVPSSSSSSLCSPWRCIALIRGNSVILVNNILSFQMPSYNDLLFITFLHSKSTSLGNNSVFCIFNTFSFPRSLFTQTKSIAKTYVQIIIIINK